MEVKKILKNNKGSGFPLAVAISICLIIIFTGISEYFRLIIIAKGVKEAMQSAVISTVNDNYDDVYHGVREGYSGAYKPVDESFEESLDYGDIYDRLIEVLGLVAYDDYAIKLTRDGKVEFSISDLEVDIKNPHITSQDSNINRFRISSMVILEVPVSFGGKLLPSMKIKVRNNAGYTPKF